MTPKIDAAALALDNESIDEAQEASEVANIIQITAEELERGRKAKPENQDAQSFTETDKLYDRKEWKAHKEHVRAGDVLFRPNYNDDPDPAVIETVEKLVDTSRVIELERIDIKALPKRRLFRFVKRVFDIVACSAALVVCAVPMAVIAVAVKLDSPGPVFYSQTRLGAYAKPIQVVKFRSMRIDAEALGAQWAQGDDPRVTKVGAFLRKSRLDELPQFWAVVKGDMSLIGPRPEREVFYNEFEKYIHGFSQRMICRPGVSGLAQVNGGYDLLPEEKILYDLEYIKHANIAMDWDIIWKTISVLFTHEGAR